MKTSKFSEPKILAILRQAEGGTPVMVVVSDDEARGFIFAYDKLFATKAKSEADIDNETPGRSRVSIGPGDCFM